MFESAPLDTLRHVETPEGITLTLRVAGPVARALAWGEVAPFYVDLEAPVPPSGVPKPGPLSVRLKDDHMQYAITWFGLALVVAAAFGFWVAGQRRAA